MWFLGASPILREAQKEKIKKKWRRRKSRNKEQRKKQYAPISKHQPWTIHTQNRGVGEYGMGLLIFWFFQKSHFGLPSPSIWGGGNFWIADFSKLTGIVSLPYIFWTAGAVREFLLLMKISDSNDVEIITLWSSLRDSMVQQGTRPPPLRQLAARDQNPPSSKMSANRKICNYLLHRLKGLWVFFHPLKYFLWFQ